MKEQATIKYLGAKSNLVLNLPYLSMKVQFGKDKTAEVPLIDARKIVGENPAGFVVTAVDGKDVAPGTITGIDSGFVNMSDVLADVAYLGATEGDITFNLPYISQPITFKDKKALGVRYEDADRLVKNNPRTFKIIGTQKEPEEPAESRMDKIIEAAKLIIEEGVRITKLGKPEVEAMEELLGFEVSAVERDEALDIMKAGE